MPVGTRTVVFTDAVGSTSWLSDHPAQVADRLRRRHLATLCQAIGTLNGEVVKTLGDGVMAVFGAAQDAVAAAVEAQRCATTPIRIGISSGDVTLEGGDCFGVAVVEASRLCDHANAGQILLSESTKLLGNRDDHVRAVGEIQLKGLAQPTHVWEVAPATLRAIPRVVLADDAALVRDGIARLLEEAGVQVVGEAACAAELLRLVTTLRPQVAIVDIRMPPTFTTEGLVAAERILTDHQHTNVLVLSQDLQPHYAARLRRARAHGVGYLLKDRVADITEFARAVREVADGRQAFDPQLGG